MTAIKFHIEVIIGGVLINSRTHSAPLHAGPKMNKWYPFQPQRALFQMGQHVYRFGSLGALFGAFGRKWLTPIYGINLIRLICFGHKMEIKKIN